MNRFSCKIQTNQEDLSDTWLPVFEDAVGDVAAHDGVDDEEDEDGQVEPDELVQLPVEEAGPLIKKQEC